MGVIYKLKDEVVQFIISQRQGNPLSSCRQLAEEASQKFDVHLSKSSVHDVLKESGFVTPRGRKPKDKFQIPQEKKKQIQSSLSKVMLLSPPAEEQVKLIEQMPDIPKKEENLVEAIISDPKSEEPILLIKEEPVPPPVETAIDEDLKETIFLPKTEDAQTPMEHEGAGRVFLKAALWDLGVYSEENINEVDWVYYLTYCKGIKVFLENDKEFFIDLPLPIERCVRTVVDGLVNNVIPLIIDKASDMDIFKSCMEARLGFKIDNISIVDQKDRILLEMNNILEHKRDFEIINIVSVESYKNNAMERAKALFFSADMDKQVLDSILELRGTDAINKQENIVNIIVDITYENFELLNKAVEQLNQMFLRDEDNRLLKVNIQTPA